MRNIVMNEVFAVWALRNEVQAAARTYILDTIEGAAEMLAKLETVMGNRCMNFGIIGGMNELFWATRQRSSLKCLAPDDRDRRGDIAEAHRGTFNTLAMEDEPYWRAVLPLFAWSIGFRPNGELSAPQGLPLLKRT